MRLLKIRSELRRFFAAAKSNNFEEVRAAIRKLGPHAKKLRPEYNGVTPLQWALVIAACENFRDSHFETIEVLIMERNNGADVNALLHRTVDKVNLKTVELLLNNGAHVNAKNNRGEVPLFRSVGAKSIEILKLLLDRGSDVNKVNEYGWTPLHLAAEIFGESDRELGLIEILIKNGANVNSQDKDGETPLHSLVQRNKVKAVELLLDHEVDVNVKDNFDEIPLFIAIRGGSCEVTRLLVDHGADVSRVVAENLDMYEKKKWKIIVEHVAKLQTLGLAVGENILDSISNFTDCSRYLAECTEELTLAKGTRIKNCWVTFFDLVTGSDRSLKNFGGNRELVRNFETSDFLNKFPIYGSEMRKNVSKGIEIRKLFDECSIKLCFNLPIFNPNHLIVRDVFDCLVANDWSRFCE